MTRIQRIGAAMVAACVGSAWGQTAGAGWDWDDATNVAESRAFAAALFAAHDTGVPMAPFAFTNPVPEVMEQMFLPQRVLFEYLYSQRLQTNPGLPGYYPLESLLDDDGAVRDQYREFLTTGVLKTSVVVDSEASYKHLLAILDSFFGNGSEYLETCAQWAAVNGEVESSCQAIKVPQPPAPNPYVQAPMPPELVNFDARLRYEVVNSRIPCIARDLYKPDSGQVIDPITHQPVGPLNPAIPGFDCDDITRVLNSWLMRHLCDAGGLNWRVAEMTVAWKCPGEQPKGHALVIVHIGGYYYLIEPQTGRIIGPIPEGTTPDGPLRPTQPDGEWIVPDCPIHYWREVPAPSDKRDFPNDAPPWYEDQNLPAGDPRKGNPNTDMWARFQHYITDACLNPCNSILVNTLPSTVPPCPLVFAGTWACDDPAQYLFPLPNWRDNVP